MAGDPEQTPKTYGELRKLLAEVGNPWEPDPTMSDEEPLPEFPTGGDGVYEPDSRTIGEGGVDDLLEGATPPTHPELRAVWRDDGMLRDEVIETPPTRPPRKGPSPTPAPDSGG
jgi:hypothetical protein